MLNFKFLKLIPKEKQIRINEQITALKVRVIDENGQQLGIMTPEQALKIAQDKGLDLIEIAAKADPPVCKILDFDKYRYWMLKEAQKKKKKQKVIQIKGIRISLRTSPHDFNLKVSQANKFLKQGHKIRLEIVLRGREFAHQDLARKKFKDFIQALGEKVKIEQELKKQRLGLAMVIAKA